MMKKALSRGGRAITVMALASAFLGSTAGAGELPAPTPPVAPETVTLRDCRNVAVTRDASLTYSLTTSRTGTQTAEAAAHGDAAVRLCWDLQATVGAAVNVVVGASATAEADAEAMAAAVVAGDSEEACVSARADLAAAAGASARAKGSVTVAIVANASADTSATDATAHAIAESHTAPVDVELARGEGTKEFAATRVCVDSSGKVTAS